MLTNCHRCSMGPEFAGSKCFALLNSAWTSWATALMGRKRCAGWGALCCSDKVMSSEPHHSSSTWHPLDLPQLCTHERYPEASCPPGEPDVVSLTGMLAFRSSAMLRHFATPRNYDRKNTKTPARLSSCYYILLKLRQKSYNRSSKQKTIRWRRRMLSSRH